MVETVVNASPLIFLAKVDQLERLPVDVATAPTVREEVLALDPVDHPEAALLDVLMSEERIATVAPTIDPASKLAGLHPGEASVIALALEHDVDEVIIDDKAAIRAAKLFDLEPVSTPFLLLRACRAGQIRAHTFERSLERLLEHRYFLSADLYRDLLDAAGAGSTEQTRGE